MVRLEAMGVAGLDVAVSDRSSLIVEDAVAPVLTGETVGGDGASDVGGYRTESGYLTGLVSLPAYRLQRNDQPNRPNTVCRCLSYRQRHLVIAPPLSSGRVRRIRQSTRPVIAERRQIARPDGQVHLDSCPPIRHETRHDARGPDHHGG